MIRQKSARRLREKLKSDLEKVPVMRSLRTEENAGLTNLQKKALLMMSDFALLNDKYPTLKDMCDALGFKSDISARAILKRLETKGAVELRTNWTSRKYRITNLGRKMLVDIRKGNMDDVEL